jgi:7,8-dihydropterin-6-yl-methyl-4-(beta-D-ribofuranosyl)aminobenzene 5'-phosphate synthase
VEVEGAPKILFDTGADGNILLSNMERLHIDPQDIREVFISHGHFDHIGGLSAFLKANSDVKLYVPVSVLGAAYGAREVTRIKAPLQIHENVFSTGELDHIEQSMALKTEQGVVVIAGCSHPT